MANPAELLLIQYRAWSNPDTSTAAANVRQPEADAWLSHRLAVRHMEAVAQLIDELAAAGRNVNVYRRYLSRWWAIAFAYPLGWQGGGSAAVDDGVLEHLENFADVLQTHVPTVQGNGLDEVAAYADLVADMLINDESLPETLRVHAMEVVGHLRWCVEKYSIVGDFELQEALERLAATVLRVAANSSEENKSKMWGPVMTNWVWPFATNIMAAIPSSALTTLALGTLG